MDSSITSFTTTRVMALTAAMLVSLAGGQILGIDIPWTGSNDLDYNNSQNWDGGAVPEVAFAEEASINNGDAVFLNSDTGAGDPGGLNVGPGSLEIQNGGRLDVVLGPGLVGNITVGVTGTLIIQSGGTLTAAGEPNLQGSTRIVGPGATFQASNFNLGSGHVLTAEITDANTHSPLSTTGTAKLAGSVVPVFTGITPSVGNSWNLVDAAKITGGFNVSSISVAPGVAMFINTVEGGTNGQVVRATVDNQLQLAVNSITGAVSINNLSTTTTVDIDGYSINSPDGVLDMNSWSSFQDDGQTGWEESNPTNKHLSELNLQGSRVIGTEQLISLGNPISLQFAQAAEVAFEYHAADGVTRSGTVEFSANTLVLRVDPNTGTGVIINPTKFDVDMDAYSIISPSGSLDSNGWTSLADSDANWEEANPLSSHLSELNLGGSQTLLQLATGVPISLGALYDFDDPDAKQDLVFEFHLSDSNTIGTYTGLVQFQSSDGLVGDYNNSGAVDAADYTVWRDSLGANDLANRDPNAVGPVGVADYDAWKTNFGNTAGSSAGLAAVPEPTALALCLLAVTLWGRRRTL